VVIEFIKRGLVRPLAVVACAFAVIIGLPRLADFFREPLYPDSVSLSVDAPGGLTRKAEHSTTKSAKPSDVPKATGGAAPVSPAPVQKSDMAKISRPEAPAKVQGAINLQAAQDVLNGRAPSAAPSAAPPAGVLSEGYLPPWDSMRRKDEQAAQAGQKPAEDGSLTLRVTARPYQSEYRRHERISRRRVARRRSRGWGGYGFFGF
jgi:hypothetical protein